MKPLVQGFETANEYAVGYQIVQCPRISKGEIDDLLNEMDDDTVLAEWDRDFNDIEDKLDMYFPCYDEVYKSLLFYHVRRTVRRAAYLEVVLRDTAFN